MAKTKLKSHRGLAKRVKLTGKGKVKAMRAGNRHLLTTKSAKRKRSLGGTMDLPEAETKLIRKLLPYGN
ncbi:MAG TPA: 50S ribosomal protein L35 [Nitrospiria bacterium]|nr:50S ribosomal protein L35 [Nitrospiria bacterium]